MLETWLRETRVRLPVMLETWLQESEVAPLRSIFDKLR